MTTRCKANCVWGILCMLVLMVMITACGPKEINPPNPGLMFNNLIKPEGEGPFPAVVLLHGCSGITSRAYEWSSRLREWGYVTLIVSSFAPRLVGRKCNAPNTGAGKFSDRVEDAYGALMHIQQLDYVDPYRIAVMGWSHGGRTTLMTVRENAPSSFILAGGPLYQAAIAFYPWCDDSRSFYAPLMILIGSADTMTPAFRCTRLAATAKAADDDVILQVYPGAHHGFDYHRLDITARDDAIRRVKEFLEHYL